MLGQLNNTELLEKLKLYMKVDIFNIMATHENKKQAI